jgi:hypothetical protein
MPTHTLGWSWESGTNTLPGTYSATGAAELNFDATISDASDTTLTGALTVANVESVFLLATQDMTVRVNAANEVQTISITGSPTGGTFTLTLSGHTTAAIAWNASAAAVQAALELLTSVGAGNVVVTGGPLPGSILTARFRKGLAATNVAQMTSTSSLTGGSSPAISHATTTAGVAAGQTITLEANSPIVWVQDLGASYGSNPLTTNWTTLLVSNDSGAPGNFYARVLYN